MLFVLNSLGVDAVLLVQLINARWPDTLVVAVTVREYYLCIIADIGCNSDNKFS